MTSQLVLGILGLILVILGGVGGVIKILLLRDRKSLDDQAAEAAKTNKESRDVIWKRLDDLRADVISIQIEQGVLRERMRNVPDHDALHARLEAIEERLERKLDNLVKQVQETLSMAISKFRCPYGPDKET